MSASDPSLLATAPSAPARLSTEELVGALQSLRADALDLERRSEAEMAAVPGPDRPSARNLLHYLAVRRHDLRAVQRELARRGLSSLGRAEAHVLATVDAVIERLVSPSTVVLAGGAGPTLEEAAGLVDRHTVAALGPLAEGDLVRQMVTMPSEAADDLALVDDIVAAGMDLARINCAHDGPDEWTRMALHVRSAARRQGRAVRIAFDIAGPKLRTSPLGDGPRVVKVRPRRSVEGFVQQAAWVRFHEGPQPDGPSAPPASGDVTPIPVEGDLVGAVVVGDVIVLHDLRGRRRTFAVAATADHAVLAWSDRTSYLGPGLSVWCERDDERVADGQIGDVPPTEAFLRLHAGDRLRIARDVPVGAPASLDRQGRVVQPATIGCALAEVFAAVQPGHRLLIDDGSIEAVVDEVADDAFEVAIVRPERAKLKGEKGINLPDTDLRIAALTHDDHLALKAVAPMADLVAMSYIGAVDDLADLRDALDALGRPDMAIAMKIEHAAAFDALPELLLHGLRRGPIAVMLARGDLAVEIGFERLAEVQEQILWLCEAAHVPVIWATQVLESMARDGLPTRAEVTDAAWASRAECVMLNKGSHIVDVMHFLDDVVARMRGHQDKRTPMLRRLGVASSFEPESSSS